MNILDELRECQKYLEFALTTYYWGESNAPLLELQKKLQACEKNLAERLNPSRVLIALTDKREIGSLSLVDGVIGTVPVQVVVVDHRTEHADRISIEHVSSIATPAEFVEAVSDEAAEYLGQDEKLMKVIAKI